MWCENLTAFLPWRVCVRRGTRVPLRRHFWKMRRLKAKKRPNNHKTLEGLQAEAKRRDCLQYESSLVKFKDTASVRVAAYSKATWHTVCVCLGLATAHMRTGKGFSGSPSLPRKSLVALAHLWSRCLGKAGNILFHPGHSLFELLQPEKRFRSPKTRTRRIKKTVFFPRAIILK